MHGLVPHFAPHVGWGGVGGKVGFVLVLVLGGLWTWLRGKRFLARRQARALREWLTEDSPARAAPEVAGGR